MRSGYLEKARLIEQKMYIVPWESPWYEKWPGSWQYHQTVLNLGLCENRGSGRSGRRFHRKEFISVSTEWKIIPKHVTRANSLCNSRKRQFGSETRHSFLCTVLFSLPEFCCLCCTFSSSPLSPAFWAQVPALMQIPRCYLSAPYLCICMEFRWGSCTGSPISLLASAGQTQWLFQGLCNAAGYWALSSDSALECVEGDKWWCLTSNQSSTITSRFFKENTRESIIGTM